MDYAQAAKELVRALRGSRSQVATQRRLRYSSNVLHSWETGARSPRASDFLGLLALTGRSPAAILRRFAECSGSSHGELLRTWLEALRRDRSHADLAKQLNVNRNTLARWLSGATEPRLPELLAFIQCTTQRLLDFIGEVVDPKLVPCVQAAYQDLEQQRALAYTSPWSHAVLRCLELESYRALPQHEPGFVAARTGITPEEEARCLKALLLAKQIYKVRGRYKVRRVLTVDTRDDAAKNLALKRHWFSVASDRLVTHGIPADGLASYNLFAIPEADLARVRAAQLDYYDRLRAIVADSTRPTRVVLVTLALLPLDQRAAVPVEATPG